jgi:DNA invertase Pin-like site-specific DNA recombinase
MAEGMYLTQAVFAQLESRMISHRVKSGMKNAAAKGAVIGRPRTTIKNLPDKFLAYYPQYKQRLIKNKIDLAAVCKCSRPTLDKYIRIYEGGGN